MINITVGSYEWNRLKNHPAPAIFIPSFSFPAKDDDHEIKVVSTYNTWFTRRIREYIHHRINLTADVNLYRITTSGLRTCDIKEREKVSQGLGNTSDWRSFLLREIYPFFPISCLYIEGVTIFLDKL